MTSSKLLISALGNFCLTIDSPVVPVMTPILACCASSRVGSAVVVLPQAPRRRASSGGKAARSRGLFMDLSGYCRRFESARKSESLYLLYTPSPDLDTPLTRRFLRC